ncbi:MAG: hypothetical protein P8R54_10905 [Myxococcota bacterium]|nr:hypothetical protein [Myxococcota bacterium]
MHPALLALSSLAQADSLEWSFPLQAGHVARIEIVAPAGETVARFLTEDAGRRSQFGWRPDTNPAEGQVSGRLEAVWLEPGEYRILEHTPAGTISRTFSPTDSPPRVLMSQLPEGAAGVLGLRWSQGGGHDGLSYASNQPGGVVFLPLGSGEWDASVLGVGGYASDSIDSAASSLSFNKNGPTPRRIADDSQTWMVRWLLAPVTLLILVAGMIGAWRIRALKGLPAIVAVSSILAGIATRSALRAPSQRILMGERGFDDPVTSASLLTATADALPYLSDLSSTFNYPEGHSWLILGPSWLAYVLAAPIALLMDGIAGHNIGVALALAATGTCAGIAARRLGAGIGAALLAAGGSTLAPALLNEIDKLSLDRACLFTVPLALLCLYEAAQTRQRAWIIGAGISIAATFYAQVYYGLYLAAAAPILVLPRLIGDRPLHRLGAMAASGVLAGVLLLPGLYTLQAATAGSVYESSARLKDTAADLWNPVSPQDAEAYLTRYDPRTGSGDAQRPMERPEDRLLAAVSNAIRTSDFTAPGTIVAGRSGLWVLMGLALLIARRRQAVAVGAFDVAVLLAMALGPLERTGDTTVGRPLPYYLLHLLIPSFDQLKHPDRYAIMASVISTIPLAVGFSGFVERIRLRQQWAVALLAAAVLFTMLAVRPRRLDESRGQWHLKTENLPLLQGERLTVIYSWPRSTAFPVIPTLAALPPGPSLMLPMTEPSPPELYLPALQHHLDVVNDAPHGLSSSRRTAYWVETNSFLNALAWASGSDRPRRFMGGTPDAGAIPALASAGLRYIVLFTQQMAGPELAEEAATFLDAHLRRVGADEQVIVWELTP